MPRYYILLALFFCFGPCSSQPNQVVKNKIVEEQTEVYHKIISNLRGQPESLKFKTKKVGDYYDLITVNVYGLTLLLSKKQKLESIRNAFHVLEQQEVDLTILPSTINISFTRKDYRPHRFIEHPDIQDYWGLYQRQYMVLHHRGGWKANCEIIIGNVNDGLRLRNVVLCAMGNVLNGYTMGNERYWDPAASINEPIDDNSELKNYVRYLNRYATYNKKAFVDEFFMYSVTDNLENILPFINTSSVRVMDDINEIIDGIFNSYSAFEGPRSAQLNSWYRARFKR